MLLGERIDPLSTRRFYIEISNIAAAVFSEVNGLDAEVEVKEYAEGGQNGFVHKLPGRMKFTNVTLKRGMTNSLDFWNWFDSARAGKVERKQIGIVLFDESGSEKRRWTLERAYPVKWIGPSLKTEDNSVVIESLELTHEGLS
ncbi:MAG TPA: phage tail protein [Dehalococcoidia bacterium]|nr:phage tail protein [Dehalococcoidia bacterium]